MPSSPTDSRPLPHPLHAVNGSWNRWQRREKRPWMAGTMPTPEFFFAFSEGMDHQLRHNSWWRLRLFLLKHEFGRIRYGWDGQGPATQAGFIGTIGVAMGILYVVFR